MARILEALLKLGLDKQSLKQSEKQIDKFEDHLEKLERRGGSIRVEFLRTWSALKKGAIDAAEATRRLEDQMKAIEEHGDRVRNFAGYFGDIAGTLAGVGAGIAGPIVLSAGLFVSKAGQADEVSRKWLATTEELERSQMRIGRVAAQSLLPLMEKVSSLAEKAAGFAERNPAAVKAALGIGGGLLGVAAIAIVAEKGIRLVADAKSLIASGQQLLAGRLMQAAAKEQLAAAAGMQKSAGGLLAKLGGLSSGALLAGSIAGGVGIGVGVNEAFAGSRWDFGEIGEKIVTAMAGPFGALINASGIRGDSNAVGFESLGKYAAVGAYGVGSLFGDDTAKRWFQSVAEALGQLPDPAERATEALSEMAGGMASLANSPHAGEILEGFIQFQEQAAEAEKQYGKARAQIIADYGEQIVETTKAHEARRAEMIQEFEKQQAQEEADFKRLQARELRDFNKSQAQELRDFNKSQAQELREHLASIASIQDQARQEQKQAEQRYKQQVADFLKNEAQAEQQAEADYYDRRRKLAEQYSLEVQRAEAEHQKQMRRMQEDHLLSMEDAVRAQDAIGFLAEGRNYERERQRAEEDYGDQVKQNSEDFARETGEMEEEFKQQRAQRQQEREQRLAEMKTLFEQEKAERERQAQERVTQAQTQFEQEQATRQTQFDEEQKERQAQFDQARADKEEDFNLERERAQQHHDEMLAKLDEANQEQLRKLDQAKVEALNTLSTQHREEQAAREKAFADQVRALDAALLGEKNTRQKYYDAMAKQLEGWLKTMQQKMQQNLKSSSPLGGGPLGPASPGYPGKASGGYVGSGLYKLGEKGYEFVTTNSTTKALEKALGGPLTQDRLLAALGGRMGGGGNTSISNKSEFNFAERMDARQIMAMVEQIISRQMTQYARGY